MHRVHSGSGRSPVATRSSLMLFYCFQTPLHAGTGMGIFFGICLVTGIVAFIGYSYLRFRKRSIGFQRFKVGKAGRQHFPRPAAPPKLSASGFSLCFIKLETFPNACHLNCLKMWRKWERLTHLSWVWAYMCLLLPQMSPSRVPNRLLLSQTPRTGQKLNYTAPKQKPLPPQESHPLGSR